MLSIITCILAIMIYTCTCSIWKMCDHEMWTYRLTLAHSVTNIFISGFTGSLSFIQSPSIQWHCTPSLWKYINLYGYLLFLIHSKYTRHLKFVGDISLRNECTDGYIDKQLKYFNHLPTLKLLCNNFCIKDHHSWHVCHISQKYISVGCYNIEPHRN